MKIPQILAQESVALAPRVRMGGSLIGQGEAALGQGLADVSAGFARLAKIEDALTQEDMKLNLVETLSALKDDYARREIDTRSRLGQPVSARGLDSTDYHPEMAKAAQELLPLYESQLKYPASIAAFRAHALPYLTEQGIKARFEGFRLQQSDLETRDGILTEQLINRAVLAPTQEERAAAFGDALNIARSGVAAGRYTGEQGAARFKYILSAVERGTALRDFRIPERQSETVQALVTGRFSTYLSAEEQFTLGKTLQAQADQDYKATRDAIDKWWKEQKDVTVSDLFAQAGRKTLTMEALESARVEWQLSRVDYDAIKDELAKPAEEAASDSATLDRVDADVHSQFPRMTERQLLQWRQTGKLNRKDYLAAQDRLRETRESLLNRGDSLQMRHHSQAEQEGMADLGIPLFFDKLEPKKEKARAAFLRELRTRSTAYGGQEDALVIKDEIIPRYKKLLDQDAQLTIEQTRKLLRPEFPTPEALEAAFRARPPQITKGEYEAQKRLFLDLDTATEIQRANDRAAAERKKTPTKPGQGGTRPMDRP